MYGRFDAQHGADREVQRILLELLNQMDGFDQSVNVKVMRQLIGTTRWTPRSYFCTSKARKLSITRDR